MSLIFKDILKQKTWDNFEDSVQEGIKVYSSELSKDITQRRRHKLKIREFLEKHFEIKKIHQNLDEELKLLSSGEAVGIDGAIGTHKTIIGIMAQIGVVAVNYLNYKIQHSYFISEAKYKQEISNVTDYLFAHEPSNKVISRPVLRAAVTRRGRKSWIELCFISQQPSHLPKEIFELCNTKLIHQTTGARNLNTLKISGGNVNETVWDDVPSLSQGRSIINFA